MNTEPSNSIHDEQLFTPLLKKIELVLVILSAASIVLKLLHASFAGSLVIVSFSSLSFFYLARAMYLGGGRLLFFQRQNPNISFTRKMTTYVSGFAISLTCIGVIFKFQFWQGSRSQILIGVLSGALAVVLTMFLSRKTGLSIYRQLLTRVTIFFAIGVMLFLTTDARLLDIVHPGNDPEKAAFKKYLEHPEDPQAQKEWEEAQHEMDSIRNLK
ncbi:MAG TPA: hypothetical protein VE978_28545 [Chitinophagales bacterium]|nr:hypothetical protein [Chitinophagales bacterium]